MTTVSRCERPHVDRSSPCISSLARCATSGGPSAPSSAASASCTFSSRSSSPCDVIDATVVGAPPRGRRARSDRRGFPTRLERVASAGFAPIACEHCERRLRVAGDRDLDLERLRLLDCRGLADRVEHPRVERAELELVEQHAHLLAVQRTVDELVGLHPEIEIAAQQRHLAVLEHAVAHLVEVLRAASVAGRRGARGSPSSVP